MFDMHTLFLFCDMEEKQTDAFLETLSEPKCFKRGEVIYDHESFIPAIGVFLEGEATADAPDSRLIKTTFSPGSVFGAAAMFGDRGPYVSRITARKDSIIQFITEDQLKQCFETYPVSSFNYIRFLSDKIRFLNQKVSQMTGKNTNAKLYRFISDNSDDSGVYHVPNMKELSRLAGIGRTSLYRALTDLESEHMLVRKDDIIILL